MLQRIPLFPPTRALSSFSCRLHQRPQPGRTLIMTRLASAAAPAPQRPTTVVAVTRRQPQLRLQQQRGYHCQNSSSRIPTARTATARQPPQRRCASSSSSSSSRQWFDLDRKPHHNKRVKKTNPNKAEQAKQQQLRKTELTRSQMRVLLGGAAFCILGIGASIVLTKATNVKPDDSMSLPELLTGRAPRDKTITADHLQRWSQLRLPAMAQTTHTAMNHYLELVSASDVLDSLERIDQLTRMTPEQRRDVARRQYAAIQEHSKALSDRNAVVLQEHFLAQQYLLQLLQCHETKPRDVCSDAVGRKLNLVERQAAREDARAELAHRIERARHKHAQQEATGVVSLEK